MDSRKITGLSMIIAPVIAILGWIGMGLIVLDGASQADPAKWMSELGANSEVVKFVMPLITVLFLIAIGGLNRIKNSMEGGEGHMMAGFGFLLVILGSAAQLGEVAFTVATAEAVKYQHVCRPSNARQRSGYRSNFHCHNGRRVWFDRCRDFATKEFHPTCCRSNDHRRYICNCNVLNRL